MLVQATIHELSHNTTYQKKTTKQNTLVKLTTLIHTCIPKQDGARMGLIATLVSVAWLLLHISLHVGQLSKPGKWEGKASCSPLPSCM